MRSLLRSFCSEYLYIPTDSFYTRVQSSILLIMLEGEWRFFFSLLSFSSGLNNTSDNEDGPYPYYLMVPRHADEFSSLLLSGLIKMFHLLSLWGLFGLSPTSSKPKIKTFNYAYIRKRAPFAGYWGECDAFQIVSEILMTRYAHHVRTSTWRESERTNQPVKHTNSIY